MTKDVPVTGKGIRHIAVVAAVFNHEGKVLLTQRNEPKYTHAHGKWHFPGGGIEFGEHPEQTAIREVKEETGLDIALVSNKPFINSFLFMPESIHAIVFVYSARLIGGTIDISNDPHTADAKWHTPEEIDFSICLPEVEKMLEKIKKYIIHTT